MDSSKLLLTLEAMCVRRFHVCSTVKPQSVGLHSAGVAHILIYLVGGHEHITSNLLLLALTHDQQELLTGDVPFTAKRMMPDLRDALETAEQVVNPLFLTDVGALPCTDRETILLKAADMLEGLLWTKHFEQGDTIHARWYIALSRALETWRTFPTMSPGELQRIHELTELFGGRAVTQKHNPHANRS